MLQPPTDSHALFRLMWLAYDAGRADARGERPLPMDEADAAIIDIVRDDWRRRMALYDRPAPTWLAALQEQHAPEPWSEP